MSMDSGLLSRVYPRTVVNMNTFWKMESFFSIERYGNEKVSKSEMAVQAMLRFMYS